MIPKGWIEKWPWARGPDDIALLADPIALELIWGFRLKMLELYGKYQIDVQALYSSFDLWEQAIEEIARVLPQYSVGSSYEAVRFILHVQEVLKGAVQFVNGVSEALSLYVDEKRDGFYTLLKWLMAAGSELCGEDLLVIKALEAAEETCEDFWAKLNALIARLGARFTRLSNHSIEALVKQHPHYCEYFEGLRIKQMFDSLCKQFDALLMLGPACPQAEQSGGQIRNYVPSTLGVTLPCLLWPRRGRHRRSRRQPHMRISKESVGLRLERVFRLWSYPTEAPSAGIRLFKNILDRAW